MFRLKAVSQRFPTPGGLVTALSDVDLNVQRGEFVVIRGPSGSGKTTLLLTLGGMLRPAVGQVQFNGRDLYDLSTNERARLRSNRIGFVFQMFHLVPYLTVEENILLASPSSKSRLPGLLTRLKLTDRRQHKPGRLSAGEKQRAAMARALAQNPEVILADEPTGNLDPANAEQIMIYLSGFIKAGGTVVVVTHGKEAEAHADRIVHLNNGHLETPE